MLEKIPMAFKRGTIQHAKGFVINKLFKQERYGGNHLPVKYLQQGYPLEHRKLIQEAIEELSAEGVIRIQKKRTGRSYANHATLVWSRLPKARGLLNGFRDAEGLPRIAQDLKTPLPIRKPR
jgi:hypothetical protein